MSNKPATTAGRSSSTGSPGFCTLWTFAGLPALNLPLRRRGQTLPLGLQLVGRHGDDARLLRTGRWLARWLEGYRAA